MKVSILGIDYELKESDVTEDIRLDGHDGYCDVTSKEVVVDRIPYKSANNVSEMEVRKRIVMRHELIHCLMFESGLDSQSFAADEALIDWIAIQFPKMARIFLECGCAN